MRSSGRCVDGCGAFVRGAEEIDTGNQIWLDPHTDPDGTHELVHVDNGLAMVRRGHSGLTYTEHVCPER